MKRSEMLDEIADIVHAFRRSTEVWTSEAIAELILETQEKAGMLPPYCPIGSESLEGHMQYCNWEPENDF